MIARLRRAAKAAALVLLSFPQLAAADTFTSADVLAWPEASQNSFFQSSITMTNIVAMQTGRYDGIVTCINEWYSTAELQAQRHDHIREVLADYPDNHPQGIILAVIEKACGSFTES